VLVNLGNTKNTDAGLVRLKGLKTLLGKRDYLEYQNN
jgi:hypothetical protein